MFADQKSGQPNDIVPGEHLPNVKGKGELGVEAGGYTDVAQVKVPHGVSR